MKQMYVPKEKKSKDTVQVQLDIAHLPSKTHKYGALLHKSQRFEDKRKKPPKYKTTEW